MNGKAERKKARRRAQRESERAAGKQLDALADIGVEEALRLAPEVVDAKTRDDAERGIELDISSVDAARYVLKRINEALAIGEWLDVVDAWVWERDLHNREPLTEGGRKSGVEVRLEKARTPTP